MPTSTTRKLGYVCVILVTVLAVASRLPCSAANQADIHIANFAQVGPRLYRGAEPDKNALAALQQLGVHTIVDLRMWHSAREEAQAKRLGMRWIHVPMGYFAPSDKQIRTLMSVLTDPSYGTVFVHCAQGADRTGTVVALYRVLVQDWPLDRVFDEMRAHHFKPWWFALRERVQTERQRLDRAKLAERPKSDPQNVDERRILLDSAAIRSLEVAHFDRADYGD